MKLDDLLRDVPAPRSDALERVRAAARAELRAAPPIAPWPTQLARLSGVTLGLALLTGAVLLAVGSASVQQVLSHAATVALLATVSVVTALAAVKPSAPRSWALVCAAGAAAMLVALRPAGVGYSPEWVCTVSHLGIGLVPLVFAVVQLRSSAFDTRRALLGGLSAGCIGAMLGEIACGRGPWHVAEYHLSAWALLGVVAVLVLRRLKPKSFAP
ncbi:MAG: DUF1109 domain-containing protein [Archangiaceae bacterium]|nr:DUF1109 domain-containing protein [Archangiaceae bacterium]